MRTSGDALGASAALARLVADASRDTVPADALVLARRMLVDGLGVAAAGGASGEFAPFRAYADGLGLGSIPAPGGVEVGVDDAAFLIAVAMHLLDYDDILPEMGHPSTVIVPPVLALAASLDASGADVVTAIAVGTEIAARLGAALNPGHYEIGWHPTAVIGTVAAAAAAAVLLDLDEDGVAAAIGLAGTSAGGSKASFGSSGKPVQVARAARIGLESARLAAAGAGGNRQLLDPGYGGFFELFSTTADRSILDVDAEHWEMLRQGVRFKFLPCCGSIHSSVWALLELVERHDVAADQIERIVTSVDRRRMPHTDRPVVTNGLSGKFSIQYCQAVAAQQRSLGLADFEDGAVGEPARQELLHRIEVRAAADADDWPGAKATTTGSRGAHVVVELRDGSRLEVFHPAPKGSKELPPRDSDLVDKFRDCLTYAGVPGAASRRLVGRLSDIDSLASVRELLHTLWGTTEQPR